LCLYSVYTTLIRITATDRKNRRGNLHAQFLPQRSGSKDKRIKEQDSGSLLCSYDSSSCKEFPVWLKISSNYYSGFTHREVRAESNTPMPYWDIWYIPVRAKYVNLLGQLLCRESWTYIFVKGTFSHINGL
jgi:hypothetical protein